MQDSLALPHFGSYSTAKIELLFDIEEHELIRR